MWIQAICRDIPIVSHEWIIQSVTRGGWVEPEPFIIKVTKSKFHSSSCALTLVMYMQVSWIGTLTVQCIVVFSFKLFVHVLASYCILSTQFIFNNSAGFCESVMCLNLTLVGY